MKLEDMQQPKRPYRAERPFPWRCQQCGQDKVQQAVIPYEAEVQHDGRLYAVALPRLELPVCQACGAKVFTEKVDDQINAALRAQLGYLTPDEMRTALERLQMTQQEAAERVGIAEATLACWLDETQLPTRALDNLLRVFFTFPEVRAVLSGPPPPQKLETHDRVERPPPVMARTGTARVLAD